MSFGSPVFLVALLAVPLAAAGYVWLERRRAARAAAWATPALLPNLVADAPGRRRHLPVAMFLLALALLLLGLARPQATFSSEREGAIVVLAVDVSASMGANDVKPTRLSAARDAALAFLKELPSKYRVALVLFSDRVVVPVTPTHDRDHVRRALLVAAAGEGTALGSGIDRSVKVALKAVGRGKPGKRPPAAVLLISDGAQTRGQIRPGDAAKRARKAAVPVSTVSLGTPNGIVERKLPGGFTERIQVPPDPATLRAVARTSGGRFFTVTSAAQLKRVYEDLGSRMARERKLHEVTAGTTGAAVLLMLGGGLLSGLWFRRVV